MILARTGCKKLKPNAVPSAMQFTSIFLHRPVLKERKPPRRREKEAVYGEAFIALCYVDIDIVVYMIIK